jgi:hypothetical protein
VAIDFSCAISRYATAMLIPLFQAKVSVGAFLLTATYAGTLTDPVVTYATAKPLGASKSRGKHCARVCDAGNEQS